MTTRNGARAIRTEILVVGSGAGGAVTAAFLSGAGYEVTLLEEGPNEDTSRIVSNSTEAIARLYRNGGMTPILGKQSIAYVEGRCVGGSTEINSGFWHRLPPDSYPRWKTAALLDAFTPEVMEPWFAQIERELSVSYLESADVPRSSALFRSGIERLGWAYQEVPRCQSGDLRGSAFAPGGAKQSMQRTYIPRALAQGTRLLADCKALRVLHDGGRVFGVEAEIGTAGRRDGATASDASETAGRRVGARAAGDDRAAERVEILADAVFLCCGAIQTPALLRRSGIKRNVGDNLCIHPMIKAAALFDEEVEAHEAALPIYQVKEFWPTITLGGAVFTPGFLAMILADSWRMYQDAMADWSRMALYYASSRGMSRGSIRVIPKLRDGIVIRYQLSEADRRNLSVGLGHLGEILFAAGAKAVYPSLSGFPVLRSVEQCRGFLENPVPIAAMGLSNVHAFSSCPMGENPDLCATDSFGRVHGMRNLHVNDASLIPDSPGVNPQGTTMAIAMRNAERFTDTRRITRGTPARARASATPDGAAAERPAFLVTGAPGWLGTRLVEVLVRGFGDAGAAAGVSTAVGASAAASTADAVTAGAALADSQGAIRCLVHPAADPAELAALSPRIAVADGDLTDPEAARRLCRDAAGSVLFHVAGLVHPARRTADFERVNVDGTRNLLAAAEEAGVRRVVVVSSNSPIGCNPYPEHRFDETSPYDPYMGYGRSKARMERVVAEVHARGSARDRRDPPAVVLRTASAAAPDALLHHDQGGPLPGPRQRQPAALDGLRRQHLPGPAPRRDDRARERRDLLDRRRAAVLDQRDRRRPSPTSSSSEFRVPCAHGQLRLPSIVGDAAWLADYALQAVGFYQQKIHVLGEMNKTIACSIEKAKRDLGYRPRWALREGMIASIRWCLEHGQQI